MGNTIFNGEEGESFMNEQGYEKALNENVKEFEFTMWDNPTSSARGGDYQTVSQIKVMSSDITYNKPGEYTAPDKKPELLSKFGITGSVVRYNQTVPWYKRTQDNVDWGRGIWPLILSSQGAYSSNKKK
ncbi:MAG: hypothetical protein PF436_12865 [Prolixibacteraceae bacterium]|nr:hypothetical protein [Prolixibacteraceae bacterium]